MRIFQAAVVVLGAVLAVLDHHQAQQQIERTSAIAAKEIHLGGERDTGGLEKEVRKEVQGLVNTDDRQFEAKPFVDVVGSGATQAVSRAKENRVVETLSILAVKAPRPLSPTLVSPREVKLLSDGQSGSRMPIARQATHHSEVGFVAGSVGLHA